MSMIFMIAQGFLVGFLASQVFPDFVWQFWAIVLANPVLTVLYCIFKEN